MKHQTTFLRSVSAVALTAVIGTVAFAAPEAGSVIGNQAVATYTNAAGDTITIGETALRFVPLCGEDFSWDQEKEMGRAYANQG